jgi:hypothetical protein
MWNDGPVSGEEGAPDLSGMGTCVTNTHLGMLACREGVGARGATRWERRQPGTAVSELDVRFTSCVMLSKGLNFSVPRL